jgi:nitrogen fixation protein NifZ
METIRYEVGDMVFAAEDILNDGGMPGIAEEEGLIAPAGMRGVIVHYGVAEMDERRRKSIWCSSRTARTASLGHPVGCLPDELTQNAQP